MNNAFFGIKRSRDIFNVEYNKYLSKHYHSSKKIKKKDKIHLLGVFPETNNKNIFQAYNVKQKQTKMSLIKLTYKPKEEKLLIESDGFQTKEITA